MVGARAGDDCSPGHGHSPFDDFGIPLVNDEVSAYGKSLIGRFVKEAFVETERSGSGRHRKRES
jgi:hypothetical protein